MEFFKPVEPAYAEELAAALLSSFIVEFSPESHDAEVRRASGKPYTTEGIEQTIAACLAAGARRFDLFFMIRTIATDGWLGIGDCGLLPWTPGAL